MGKVNPEPSHDSDDPTYRPLVFDYAEGDGASVSVIGRVVWFCPPVEWSPAD